MFQEEISDTVPRRTSIWNEHKKLGAKFTEFAGWEMPVLYSGVIEEHHAVRSAAGLFDVSHMGEIFVSGPGAEEFLQKVTSNNVKRLFPGKAQYALLPNEKGGAVDDVIVYCLSPEEFLVCVNAANVKKDYAWFQAQLPPQGMKTGKCVIEDHSDRFAQVALQGPKAAQILNLLLASPKTLSLADLPYFFHRQEVLLLNGVEVRTLIARTGYTGEDGFEIFCASEDGPLLWRSLLEAGEPWGLKPVGLGARDTLRLEAALPLYGHELGEDIPISACGMDFAIKLEKDEMIGVKEIRLQKAQGTPRRLIGFEVVERGIVRLEALLFDDSGKEVGVVTSGTFSPTLNKAIGLAYVDTGLAIPQTRLCADVRGRKVAIQICKASFYKRQLEK